MPLSCLYCRRLTRYGHNEYTQPWKPITQVPHPHLLTVNLDQVFVEVWPILRTKQPSPLALILLELAKSVGYVNVGYVLLHLFKSNLKCLDLTVGSVCIEIIKTQLTFRCAYLGSQIL